MEDRTAAGGRTGRLQEGGQDTCRREDRMVSVSHGRHCCLLGGVPAPGSPATAVPNGRLEHHPAPAMG